jgi:hypothetical protein
MASYLDIVSDLAAGKSIKYADLSRDEQQHVRSLKAEGFVKSVASNGKPVLLNHVSALVKITESGASYAEMLRTAGAVTAPPKADTVTKTEAVGRHAKPDVYAEIDERIAAREKAAKPSVRSNRPKKKSPKTTKRVRTAYTPQDLDKITATAALLNELLSAHNSFTDQLVK